MSEINFQREVLSRLGHMEADIKSIKTDLEGWKGQIAERCGSRGREFDYLWTKHNTVDKRVASLESIENQRKGGLAVIAALLTAAGALGGLAAKMLSGT